MDILVAVVLVPTEIGCASTRNRSKVCKSAVAAVFGDGAEVWLFGSRVDDSASGGDIDLLVRPPPDSGRFQLMDKIRLVGRLERVLGERKIDSIVEEPRDPRLIVRIAHESGVPLLAKRWSCWR
jgi:predicted nucleotidyltransferase